MATLTINYYYPFGISGASEVLIGTRTFALNAGNTFTIPDRSGSPGTAFTSIPPADAAGYNFTGWDVFTYQINPNEYPIQPGGGSAYWSNGIPGQTAFADAIAAANGGGTFPTLTSVTLNVTGYYNTPTAVCFKEDSEILTYDEAADKESYIKVQDLRKGMLVKTLRSGYVPVKIATSSKIYNSGNSHRSENRLYRCPTSVFPELKEDLIITGHHSILVDNLTEEQVNEIQDTYGRIYITEKKYRLPAFVDERTVPYEEEGTFNIYHFALENSNVKANYGVYANGGLLVESANEWRLREKSGHKIISE